MLTTNHGYVPVTYTSSTPIAGKLDVGTTITVTGSGTLSGPIAASYIASSNAVTESGTVSNLVSGKFNMLTTAHGYVPVTYTSGTSMSGTLANGKAVTVTGSGSLTGPIAAASISVGSSSSPSDSPISESGSVSNLIAGSFNMKTTSHGYVPVTYTSGTSVSGSLSNGVTVTVTGSGSLSGPIAASSISVGSSGSGGGTSTPPPTSGVAKHLNTADYVGVSTSMNVAYSTLAPHLTWALTVASHADALHAVGIKTQHYIDPNRVSTGDPLMPNTSSGYARTCSGTAVTTTYHSLLRYVPNPADSSFRTEFANYVNYLGPSHFDALYDDDAEAPGTYGSYSPSLPCGYSDSTWMANEEGMLARSSIPVIVTALNALNGQDVSLTMQMVKSSAAWGGNYEECYNATSLAKQQSWPWLATENSEIQVNAAGKVFQCMGDYPGYASSNTDARLFMLASYLLTYDPRDIYWERFETPSHFHVEPESQLVALSPVKSTPSTIQGLQTSGGTYGTYGREYANCYYAGTSVGPCAAVVNIDSVSHPFPFSGYHHTLYLSGGGIIDGGSASVSGSAPSSVPAGAGIIAFKN